MVGTMITISARFIIIDNEKEANSLRLLYGLNRVQKVGSSNLSNPTIASNFLV